MLHRGAGSTDRVWERGWKTSMAGPQRRWPSVKHAGLGDTSLQSLQSFLHPEPGSRVPLFNPSSSETLPVAFPSPCPPHCSPSPVHRTTTVTTDMLPSVSVPSLSDSPGDPKIPEMVATHTECGVPEGPRCTCWTGMRSELATASGI